MQEYKTANLKPSFFLFLLYSLLAVCAAFPDVQGTDFFPIFTGIKNIFSGVSPYAASVIAYPLPALLFLAPFGLVPDAAASAVWFGFLLLGLSFAIFKTARSNADVLAALLFYPLFTALVIKTSSVLWLAAAMLCVFKTEERKPWLLGLLLAFLPLKPQIGLLLFPYALYLAYKNNRAALKWMLVFSAIIWILSFALFPAWVPEWLAAVKTYKAQVVDFKLGWFFGAFAVLGLNLPLAAPLAAASLALFPVNDIYSCILLLVFFRSMPQPLFFVSAFSMLMLLLPHPNSAYAVIIFVWLPAFIWLAITQIKNLWAPKF